MVKFSYAARYENRNGPSKIAHLRTARKTSAFDIRSSNSSTTNPLFLETKSNIGTNLEEAHSGINAGQEALAHDHKTICNIKRSSHEAIELSVKSKSLANGEMSWRSARRI